MANLKEIRTRISSVKSTRQITSAMKMVAAAKLRKSQDSIVQMRPYATKLQEILSNLSESLDSKEDNKYAQQRPADKVLLILITSNKGLCGGFNSNILKKTDSLLKDKYKDQFKKGNVSFIAIGKKAVEYLKRTQKNMISSHNELLEESSFNNVAQLADSIMKRFVNKTFDKVEIVYNEFKNAANQNTCSEQFLPIEVKSEEGSKINHDYIFEPSKEYIVNELIPKSLKVQIFKAILDSIASEHGARMTAMHQATDNATELLKDLQLDYNKARQAAITNEILEIVSGAEALKG
ncbi:MAG: ATP synthase F1 subunit gamma [Marinilabiliales bacterium]|nr:MAG: ATP synthase F1 subunit gamma [Marinilabiliales bacterium]